MKTTHSSPTPPPPPSRSLNSPHRFARLHCVYFAPTFWSFCRQTRIRKPFTTQTLGGCALPLQERRRHGVLSPAGFVISILTGATTIPHGLVETPVPRRPRRRPLTSSPQSQPAFSALERMRTRRPRGKRGLDHFSRFEFSRATAADLRPREISNTTKTSHPQKLRVALEWPEKPASGVPVTSYSTAPKHSRELERMFGPVEEPSAPASVGRFAACSIKRPGAYRQTQSRSAAGPPTPPLF